MLLNFKRSKTFLELWGNMKQLLIALFLLNVFSTDTFANQYQYKVLRVIDGDTVQFEAKFLPKPLDKSLKLRIVNIDTPEKGPLAKCSIERDKSSKAKEFVETKIASSNNVLVEIIKWDKYGGRVLGDLILDGKRLSELLIENDYAVSYYGKKKVKDWCK